MRRISCAPRINIKNKYEGQKKAKWVSENYIKRLDAIATTHQNDNNKKNSNNNKRNNKRRSNNNNSWMNAVGNRAGDLVSALSAL